MTVTYWCQTLLTRSEATRRKQGKEDSFMLQTQGMKMTGAAALLSSWGSAPVVLSAQFSGKKHPAQQQDVWVLARTAALTQLSACPAQQAENNTEYRCGKDCPSSLTLLQQCLNTATSSLGASPILYKCLTVLGDICCAHSFSHCHNAGQRLTEKHLFP